MKLYFWNRPYDVSYGASMLFVVADNLKQAREVARTNPKYITFGTPERGKTPRWLKDVKLGEPDRVVKLPCAEFHEWSE